MTEKEKRREIQNLRTELNRHKKCINQIIWAIEHKKTAPYDYGEGNDAVISNIKEIISESKIE